MPVGNGDISQGDTPAATTGQTPHRDVNLQRIRDRAMKLKSDLVENFESQLQGIFEEFIEDVEKIEQNALNGTKSSDSSRKNGELPDKEFITRKSVLTELLESNHIRTIYHIFVAILIVFSLNTFVFDLVDTGRVVLDFKMMWWAFDKFPTVMAMWLCMKFCTIIVIFPLFQYWAHNRPTGGVVLSDYIWLSAYTIYQCAFLIFPLRMLTIYELPIASSVVVVCEQVRLLMKAHAFVRENIPRVLAATGKKDDDATADNRYGCPDFSKYLYFLFAPTLVYRDTYPRTPTIRWNYVVTNFAQVLACLFYIYYIFVRFCVPVFQNFSSESVTIRELVLASFGCMMPGTLVLFIGFFAVLHSWLNAFAEMLRFGDRLFYKDWWNSSSFSNYYRTWNVVVHDWLYSYVYKDCYKLLRVNNRPNRTAAMASVFLLSAFFHEYILIVSFRFFYPVLFIMFAGAGFAFIFLPTKKSRTGNVFMWVALFIGTGLLMCLYSMEWFARKNCPVTANSVLDYFIPRSWTCDYTLS